MRKKKERWIKRNPINFWIISVLGIILLIFVGEYNSDYWKCRRYPDKCVCENINTGFNKYNFEICNAAVNDEYKIHLKTQSELDTESCNNNPREDEKCKCEKKDVCYQSIIYENEEKINDTTFRLSLKLETKDEKTCFPELTIKNYTMVTGIQKSYVCLESRPKTDWELHPENYVEEKECVEYQKEYVHNTYTYLFKRWWNYENIIKENYIVALLENLSILPIEVCDVVRWNYYPQISLFDERNMMLQGLSITKYNFSKKELLNWLNNYINEREYCRKVNGEDCSNFQELECFKSYPDNIQVCVKNQTTYRLKNECERGDIDFMEESVEEINYLPCNNNAESCDEGNLIQNCTYKCQVIRYDKICREKTEVEKLMDKDCDWLFVEMWNMIEGHQLRYKPTKDYNKCNNPNVCKRMDELRQVWREKGCRI